MASRIAHLGDRALARREASLTPPRTANAGSRRASHATPSSFFLERGPRRRPLCPSRCCERPAQPGTDRGAIVPPAAPDERARHPRFAPLGGAGQPRQPMPGRAACAPASSGAARGVRVGPPGGPRRAGKARRRAGFSAAGRPCAPRLAALFRQSPAALPCRGWRTGRGRQPWRAWPSAAGAAARGRPPAGGQGDRGGVQPPRCGRKLRALAVTGSGHLRRGALGARRCSGRATPLLARHDGCGAGHPACRGDVRRPGAAGAGSAAPCVETEGGAGGVARPHRPGQIVCGKLGHARDPPWRAPQLLDAAMDRNAANLISANAAGWVPGQRAQ
jgi:hypothetical protein